MEKRQTYTEEARRTHLEKWQSSDLSAPKYCKEAGVSPHTFKNWQKQYRRSSKNKEAETFVPVKIKDHPDLSNSNPGEININYPNGLQISCPLNVNIEHLKAILEFS